MSIASRRPRRSTFSSRAIVGGIVSLCFAGAYSTANAAKVLSLKNVSNAGLGSAPGDLDRSTPRRSFIALKRACRDAKFERAAHLLNLDDTPVADQRVVGTVAAKRLCALFPTAQLVDNAEVDDTSIGPFAKSAPANVAVVGGVTLLGAQRGEIWLRRFTTDRAGVEIWLVTRKTVSLIDPWYFEIVERKRGRSPINYPDLEVANLGTPRAAAIRFRKLARSGDLLAAAKLLYRDGGVRADKEGQRLAKRLYLLLERVDPEGLRHLSNDAHGAAEKGIAFDEEVVARVEIGKRIENILLTRYPLRGGDAVWLFSSASVGQIDRLYQAVGYGWAGDHLPALMIRIRLWQVQLWQWVGLLLILVGAILCGIIVSWVTRRILLFLAKATSWEWDDEVVATMRGPLNMIYAAAFALVAAGFLALESAPQENIARLCRLAMLVGVGWFGIRTVDIAGIVLHSVFERRQNDMGLAMVPVARRIFKPIAVLIVLTVVLQNAGVDVTGLIAGLSIGAFAFGLAAKTTVENMLGGITIAFDRPFKVGDFIRVGSLLGSVEEVGLRSTRVRTLDRTVVTIPNSQMVDSHVENFAPRDRIRLAFSIGVQYDSSLEQIRFIVDEIKRELLANDKVFQDSFRVRFNNFGDSALEIEVYVYISTSDYHEFTAIKEAMLLKIGEIVADSGAQFAFPSRTIYTGKASDMDSRKAKAAATRVQQRDEAGELTIPEIPEKVRRELRQGALTNDASG